MKRFGYSNYTNKDTCRPLELNRISILRGDNVIIDRAEELEDICPACKDKEYCVEILKRMKRDLYSNLYSKGQMK